MSARLDTAGTTQVNSEALFRTTSVPSSTTYSASFWLYRIGDNNTSAILLGLRSNPYIVWTGLYLATDGTTLSYDDNTGGAVAGPTLAANTWTHIGIVKNGAAVVVYVNGVSSITDNNLGNPTVDGIAFGSLGNFGSVAVVEPFNGRYAAMKIWSGVALTAAEIQTEMLFLSPVRLAGLWFYNHLMGPTVAALGTDLSGSGNTFTAVGTLTIEDGPPISWAPRRRGVVRVTGVAPPSGRIWSSVGFGGGLVGPRKGLAG